ncbi:hypothetical protein SA19082_17550 [Staphylococcus argenteus]|nr:hypothetical protein SA19082_17550 [Staphylococcus argenteus]GJF65381.1 hypothetical protein SA19133_17220 [Staphylococcus argenteus]GJF78285.1 hypothetical protein SA19223_18230 [Staphylococcus argenteus]
MLPTDCAIILLKYNCTPTLAIIKKYCTILKENDAIPTPVGPNAREIIGIVIKGVSVLIS